MRINELFKAFAILSIDKEKLNYDANKINVV